MSVSFGLSNNPTALVGVDDNNSLNRFTAELWQIYGTSQVSWSEG